MIGVVIVRDYGVDLMRNVRSFGQSSSKQRKTLVNNKSDRIHFRIISTKNAKVTSKDRLVDEVPNMLATAVLNLGSSGSGQQKVLKVFIWSPHMAARSAE